MVALSRGARRGWRLALALSLLVVAALGQGTTVFGQVPGGDPRFGAVQAIESPDKAAEAGVRWERIIFPWALMQPNSSNEMLPTYYIDERIEAQARKGITQVGVVLYTPAWAAVDSNRGWGSVPRGLDQPYTDERNSWARFVNRLAAKYKGTVDHWIVWNEPDMVNLQTRVSTNWAGSEEEFWLLQKSAYLAIKQANPQAQVLLPGFSHWHSKELGRPQYLKRLLDVAAKDSSSPQNNWYFEGVPTHPYGNPLNSFGIPETYRRILAERGLENKPIWNVEANVIPWDDPIGIISRQPWRASMDEQASFVIQSLALGLAAKTERMSIYKLTDEHAEDGQHFGLLRADGSARPAFRAFQTAIRTFSGVKDAALTWDGSSMPLSTGDITTLLDSVQPRFQFVCPCHVAQVAMERDNQRITVVWNTRPTPVVGVVDAAATQATLIDPAGSSSTVRAVDGTYRVYLSGARSDTEPRDDDVRLVGGRPWILVEDVPGPTPPSRPPRMEPATRYDRGFAIANGQFEAFFREQGASALGAPISREFDLEGFPTQVFQRQILQLREDGSVASLDPRGAEISSLRLANVADMPVGEQFRTVATGQGLSTDLENRVKDSPLLRQYRQSEVHGLARPEVLSRSNLRYAFEPD